MASYTLHLDQAAIDRELRTRNGAVGKVMAGFAGLATATVREEMRTRAGGVWWPVSSSMQGTTLQVNVKASRPHVIVPVRARALVFQVGGQTVFTRHVNHPGSSPPEHLIGDALVRAGSLYSVLGAVVPV